MMLPISGFLPSFPLRRIFSTDFLTSSFSISCVRMHQQVHQYVENSNNWTDAGNNRAHGQEEADDTFWRRKAFRLSSMDCLKFFRATTRSVSFCRRNTLVIEQQRQLPLASQVINSERWGPFSHC